jgi:hypothetical protein
MTTQTPPPVDGWQQLLSHVAGFFQQYLVCTSITPPNIGRDCLSDATPGALQFAPPWSDFDSSSAPLWLTTECQLLTTALVRPIANCQVPIAAFQPLQAATIWPAFQNPKSALTNCKNKGLAAEGRKICSGVAAVTAQCWTPIKILLKLMAQDRLKQLRSAQFQFQSAQTGFQLVQMIVQSAPQRLHSAQIGVHSAQLCASGWRILNVFNVCDGHDCLERGDLQPN